MTSQGALMSLGHKGREASAQFQVVLVGPSGYVHSAALAEVIETVAQGLSALGCEVTLAVNRLDLPGPRTVLFGAHLLSAEQAQVLPSSTIIYNLEQIDRSSSWCSPTYLGLLKRCEVWDYSARNMASLARLGVTGRAKHVPIGYVPQLTRINPSAVEDIDVLFYGSMNERRARVVGSLRETGLKAEAVFAVYGAERDALISRAKVVLNLHYYETSIFELVRVSYLLANHKAVVAECHSGTEIDADIVDAVRLAPYDELAHACAELVADDHARASLADRGFSRMAAREETTYLANALGWS